MRLTKVTGHIAEAQISTGDAHCTEQYGNDSSDRFTKRGQTANMLGMMGVLQLVEWRCKHDHIPMVKARHVLGKKGKSIV